MLKILACGPLNTIQDRGRFGARRLGVGVAGPMDPVSFRIGNILVGNPDDDAAIEIQTYPFEAEILRAGRFAVTGAGRARLDGIQLPGFWSGFVRAGQVLSIAFGPTGVRSYLCAAGGFDVPQVLGSRSTQLRGGFGGFQGRELTEGDEIDIGRPSNPDILDMPDYGVSLPCVEMSSPCDRQDTHLIVRAVPGAEYALFTPEARALFWSTPWTITQLSNRTGYRLAGEALSLTGPVEMRSHGVLPGVVQVPPAGQPIVQMMDGNTVGGYPKIAHVIDADMWRLGQASANQTVRFVRVSHQEAVAASEEVDAYLDSLRLRLSRFVSATRVARL